MTPAMPCPRICRWHYFNISWARRFSMCYSLHNPCSNDSTRLWRHGGFAMLCPSSSKQGYTKTNVFQNVHYFTITCNIFLEKDRGLLSVHDPYDLKIEKYLHLRKLNKCLPTVSSPIGASHLFGGDSIQVIMAAKTLDILQVYNVGHSVSKTLSSHWHYPHQCSVNRNSVTNRIIFSTSLSNKCSCQNGTNLFSLPKQFRCANSLQGNKGELQRTQIRHFTKTVEIREEDVVQSSDIQKFLAEKGMKFDQGFTCFITACPQTVRKKGSPNWGKLYINMTTGHFLCGTCGKLGGWLELKDHISLLANLKKKKDYECFKDVESVYRLGADTARVTDMWSDTKVVKSLSEEELDQLREDFDCQLQQPIQDQGQNNGTAFISGRFLAGTEELSKITLEKFLIGYNPGMKSVVFPYHNPEGDVIGIKRVTCRVGENEMSKTIRETSIPRSGILGLFGWNTVGVDTTEVVLTMSEMNAMAVYQETKVPALSLPKGYTVLSQEVLPSLERFKKVLLWFGDDIRAWEAAKQFAKKLNTKRCYVIRPTAVDPSPYTALKQGLRLKNILSKAKPISHKSIVSFSQLRQEIFSELAHVEQVAGVKWRRYPALNRLLKGHRRGELTVFTGPTGSGKTTFMSDYSLDLCMQGVNTLWGSFEINNVRLGKMMLTQFSMKNLSKHLDEFDMWANMFEELPIYFMTFHGQESIRKVIETMSHAVYVHDIAHVVVDNLQFMMGIDGDWANKFTRQDMIISAFRRFATTMNCHVSLVIHPRKEKDTEELTTASIFGSAKASQEADNVLLLQDKRLSSLRGRKYVQITKNRFDGELGIMLLKFDKDSLSFAVKDKPKKSDGKKREETVQEKEEEETYPET